MFKKKKLHLCYKTSAALSSATDELCGGNVMLFNVKASGSYIYHCPVSSYRKLCIPYGNMPHGIPER
jgi:hypothetical protein